MAQARRKFDQDFRDDAVRIVRESGRPIAQVARELGVNAGTLGDWVNLDRRRPGARSGALSEDERAELARLRRENAELAMERDVLKRSAALPLSGRRDEALSPAAVVASQTEEHEVRHAVRRSARDADRTWLRKWRDGRVPAGAARRFAARWGSGPPAGRRLIAGTVAVLAFIAVIAAVTGSIALGGIPVVAALFAWYWAPTATAYRRHAPNAEPILMINLFLGWTLVGWVVAMAMAVRSMPPAPPAPSAEPASPSSPPSALPRPPPDSPDGGP
jgi:transposase